MAELTLQEVDDGVIFKVKVVPGSSKTAVGGLLDDMVKIKVSAAPEKGKANQRLVEFLAGRLGLKKNAVSILSGKTGPTKSVRVVGISGEELLEKLNLK